MINFHLILLRNFESKLFSVYMKSTLGYYEEALSFVDTEDKFVWNQPMKLFTPDTLQPTWNSDGIIQQLKIFEGIKDDVVRGKNWEILIRLNID